MDAVTSLFEHPAPWLAELPDGDPVVVSTRVRLARNLAGRPFPGSAALEQRRAVLGAVASAVDAQGLFAPAQVVEMHDLDAVDREVLFERRLASRELTRCGAGSGVVLSADERAALMINEEDHLRLQVLLPGLQLSPAYAQAAALDTALGSALDFAFDANLGYLTACPTNVGTGLRASVMMHLPGLVLAERMTAAMNAAAKLGLAVRGAFGEGSDATGNMFQFSNQVTLGEDEATILARLDRVVGQVLWHERQARRHVLHTQREQVLDGIGRACGVLGHARVLSAGEALDGLAALRFGVDLGVFSRLTMTSVNAMIMAVQPGHLQRRAGTVMEPEERDVRRAALLRDWLAVMHEKC